MAKIIEFPFIDRIVDDSSEEAKQKSIMEIENELRMTSIKFNERLLFDITISTLQDGTHIIARPIVKK